MLLRFDSVNLNRGFVLQPWVVKDVDKYVKNKGIRSLDNPPKVHIRHLTGKKQHGTISVHFVISWLI